MEIGLYNECPSPGCGHLGWEHDLGGEARACRYCTCQLTSIKPSRYLPPRRPKDFAPKPEWLRGSSLWGSGLGTAGRAGQGRTGVYIMAEALGQDEEREGKPLVGVAGKLTSRMVARTPDPENGERLDLERDFWRGNIIPIKPPFDKLDLIPWPERLDLMQRCKPSWEQDLKETNPRAILALGATALRALTGSGEISAVRGCIFETEYGPVIPTYHPAYIGRGKFNLTRVWQVDLRRALYVSRHGIPRYPKHYTLYPTGMDADAFYRGWVEAGRPPIAFDIETPHSKSKDDDPLIEDEDRPVEQDPSYQILEIGFSYTPYEAICFPWSEPFIGVAKRILEEAPLTYQWNGYAFDIPRLEASGATLGGDSVDLMLLWHFLEPGLPMGLKPTAAMYFFDTPAGWANKTLARDDPKLYSCLDNDFTLRLGQMFTTRAKEKGVWEKFLLHYVKTSSILRRMTRVGLAVDRERMARAGRRFELWKRAAISRLQPLVPLEVPPKKVFTYDEERLKREGKWVEGRMVRVERMEKPPRPKKLPFRVYYLVERRTKQKSLIPEMRERSKKVLALTAEEAMGKVPGAVRAEKEDGVPLKKGKSQKVISENIREFHGGETYQKTAKKFGKAKADKQAVAVALETARRGK